MLNAAEFDALVSALGCARQLVRKRISACLDAHRREWCSRGEITDLLSMDIFLNFNFFYIVLTLMDIA